MKELFATWWEIDGSRFVLIVLLVGVILLLVRRALGAVVRLTHTDLDDAVLDAVSAPIRATAGMLVTWYATELIEPSIAVSEVIAATLKTLAVVVWGRSVAAVVSLTLTRLSLHPRPGSLVQPRTVPMLVMGTRLGLIVLGLYAVCVVWEVDVTAWLASAGVIGIVVGLAAKDTVGNLFSGMFILADGPYKVGDFVVLEGNLRGRVTDIGLRSTRVLTRDDIEITVPNAVIAAGRILNESGGPQVSHRVRAKVSFAYGSDLDRVRALLMSCATPEEGAAVTPEPRVRLRALGESGLELELLFWVEDSARRGTVLDAVNSRIYEGAMRVGLEIPSPRRDVRLLRTEGSGASGLE